MGLDKRRVIVIVLITAVLTLLLLGSVSFGITGNATRGGLLGLIDRLFGLDDSGESTKELPSTIGGACGDGILDTGEQCEPCVIDADCSSGLCTDAGVCALDSLSELNPCNDLNPFGTYNKRKNGAKYIKPESVAFGAFGALYVSDEGDDDIFYSESIIKKVYLGRELTGNVINGDEFDEFIYDPSDIVVTSQGSGDLYYSTGDEYPGTPKIFRINLNLPEDDGLYLTLGAGGLGEGGVLCYGDANPSFCREGVGLDARFSKVNGMFLDEASGVIFVADGGVNNRIREFDIDSRQIRTVAGGNDGSGTACSGVGGGTYCKDGSGAGALFDEVVGITGDGQGTLYVIDGGNSKRIRKVTHNDGEDVDVEYSKNWDVETLVGDGEDAGVLDACSGSSSTASFDNPYDIEYDGLRGKLYVSEKDLNVICQIDLNDPNYQVTLLSGSPSSIGSFKDGYFADARFNAPMKMEMERFDRIFVADSGNFVVRALDLGTGRAGTISGVAGVQGTGDDAIYPAYDCGETGQANECSCLDGSGICGNDLCEEGEEINCQEDCPTSCEQGICDEDSCTFNEEQCVYPNGHHVEIGFISDTEVALRIDGQLTNSLSEGQSYLFDGTIFHILEIRYGNMDGELAEVDIGYWNHGENPMPAILSGPNFYKCNDIFCTGAVDEDHWNGETYSSMVKDSSDRPYIAFRGELNEDLQFVGCLDPSCSSSGLVLLYSPPSGYVIGDISIDLGHDGNPAIAFFVDDGGNSSGNTSLVEGLYFIKCSDPVCTGPITMEVLDLGLNNGVMNSMKVGSDGNPAIAYFRESMNPPSLAFIHCQDPSCSQPATPKILYGLGGNHNSIVIGEDGNPVIFFRASGFNILLIHCQDPSCSGNNVPVTVDSGSHYAGATSIVIGEDGNPVMSYYDTYNQELRSAHCNNADCSSIDPPSILDISYFNLYGNSISIGIDGFPAIAYSPGSDLKYLKCSSIDCTTFHAPVEIYNNVIQTDVVSIV